tara:strand:- start:61 stop:414 length:354 start_codon:yes stop_codon:yes gene_type:complete
MKYSYEYELEDGSVLKMALSNKQSKRLGAIISVVFEEDLPSGFDKELEKDGFIAPTNNAIGYEYRLTEKGLDEKNRLATLAGLNIKYQSERDRNAIQAKEAKKAEATKEVVIGASEI